MEYTAPASPSGSAISDGDPPNYFAPPFQQESVLLHIPEEVNQVLTSSTRNVSPHTPYQTFSNQVNVVEDTRLNTRSSIPIGQTKEEFTRSPSSESGVPKREFDELEEIVFADPRSFTAMAFAIAESRGMQLVISEDRTYKVTSAYMHVACSYRKSNCPFVLKIIVAKEGGWILKTPKSTEVDARQRSVYHCRHPPGSIPEEVTEDGLPLPKKTSRSSAGGAGGGISVGGNNRSRSGGNRRKNPFSRKRPSNSNKSSTSDPRTRNRVPQTLTLNFANSQSQNTPIPPPIIAPTAVVSSVNRSNDRRESSSVKRERKEDDPVEGKLMTSRESRSNRPRTSTSNLVEETTLNLQTHSPGAPSATVNIRAGEDLPRVLYHEPVPSVLDRALAPPFERSVSLHSQISPVLSAGHPEVGADGRPFVITNGKINYYQPPAVLNPLPMPLPLGNRLSFPPSNPSQYQQIQQQQQQQQQLLHQQQLLAPHYRASYPTHQQQQQPVTPFLEPPSPISLPQWTTFLTLLDPELIMWAKTLASPSLAVSPDSFFREDEEMRLTLIDSLDIPTWPRLKLKSKIKAKGEEVWRVMESMELERRVSNRLERSASNQSNSNSNRMVAPPPPTTTTVVEDSMVIDENGECKILTNGNSSSNTPSSKIPASFYALLNHSNSSSNNNSPATLQVQSNPTTRPISPSNVSHSNMNTNNHRTVELPQPTQTPTIHRRTPPVLGPLILEPTPSNYAKAPSPILIQAATNNVENGKVASSPSIVVNQVNSKIKIDSPNNWQRGSSSKSRSEGDYSDDGEDQSEGELLVSQIPFNNYPIPGIGGHSYN